MANKGEVKEYYFEYKMGFMMTIATIITIIAIVIPVGIIFQWYDSRTIYEAINGKMYKWVIVYLVVFLWMVLHEIIHGTFYILGGAKRKNITYGSALEKGIFYCRCGEYVNKKTIMMSLMAPFTIIGVITMIIGLIAKLPWLVLLSGINIGGAGADLCMFFFFIKRDKDVKFMEYGDSSIFSLKTTEDLSNKKFLCVKSIDKDKVPKNDNKKRLVVSKASWKIAIAFLVLFILMILVDFI